MKRKTSASKPSAAGISFEQLATFSTLARLGKQAAARAALGKSQSQISRDLAALERGLGGALLFDRDSRRPTAAGAVLAEYAEEALAGLERTRARLADAGHASGILKLAVAPELFYWPLLPALAAARRRLPDVQIEAALLPSIEIARRLRDGDVDLGLLRQTPSSARLHGRPFLKARLYAAVPARWSVSQRRQLSLQVVKEHRLLAPPPQTVVRELVDAAFRKQRLRNVSLSEIDVSRTTALTAAEAELGIALLLCFDETADPLINDAPQTVRLTADGPQLS